MAALLVLVRGLPGRSARIKAQDPALHRALEDAFGPDSFTGVPIETLDGPAVADLLQRATDVSLAFQGSIARMIADPKWSDGETSGELVLRLESMLGDPDTDLEKVRSFSPAFAHADHENITALATIVRNDRIAALDVLEAYEQGHFVSQQKKLAATG